MEVVKVAFAVVDFVESKQCAVVPVNWIREGCTFWPTGKWTTHHEDIMKRGVPITPAETWELHPVTVMGIFATYAEGRANLKKAEKHTDLETTDPEMLGKGMRNSDGNIKKKKKKRIPEKVSSSSDSDVTELEDPPSFTPLPTSKPSVVLSDVQVEDFLFTEDMLAECESESILGNNFCPQISSTPLISKPPISQTESHSQKADSRSESLHKNQTVKRRKKSSLDSGSAVSMSAEEWLHRTQSYSERRKTGSLDSGSAVSVPAEESLHRTQSSERRKTGSLDSGSTVSVPADVIQRLVRSNQVLKANQRIIMDMLDVLVKRDNSKDDPTRTDVMGNILSLLPLKDEEDVACLEALLLEESTLQIVINYLKGIGGFSVEDIVRNILRRLFTDRCAVEYSFLGQRGKKSLRQLNIYKAILGAAKLNTMVNIVYEADVDKCIKNWLRHAKSRIKDPTDGNKL